jgi:hypothetical protein
MKLEELMAGEDSKPVGTFYKLAGYSDENSGVQKVRNWNNCGILPNSEQISQPRAKQGFYVGPALDHNRCYKLVKSETKQKAISNMVEFRHTYLQLPSVSVDGKIINGL